MLASSSASGDLRHDLSIKQCTISVLDLAKHEFQVKAVKENDKKKKDEEVVIVLKAISEKELDAWLGSFYAGGAASSESVDLQSPAAVSAPSPSVTPRPSEADKDGADDTRMSVSSTGSGGSTAVHEAMAAPFVACVMTASEQHDERQNL